MTILTRIARYIFMGLIIISSNVVVMKSKKYLLDKIKNRKLYIMYMRYCCLWLLNLYIPFNNGISEHNSLSHRTMRGRSLYYNMIIYFLINMNILYNISKDVSFVVIGFIIWYIIVHSLLHNILIQTYCLKIIIIILWLCKMYYRDTLC